VNKISAGPQPIDFITVPLSKNTTPPFEYCFKTIPYSQDAERNRSLMSSQASADSQYSSGYYSENSSLSNSSSDSFFSNSKTPLHPKGGCKHFTSKERSTEKTVAEKMTGLLALPHSAQLH